MQILWPKHNEFSTTYKVSSFGKYSKLSQLIILLCIHWQCVIYYQAAEFRHWIPNTFMSNLWSPPHHKLSKRSTCTEEHQSPSDPVPLILNQLYSWFKSTVLNHRYERVEINGNGPAVPLILYSRLKLVVSLIMIGGSICESTVVYKNQRYKFQNRLYKFIEKVTVLLKNIDCTADSNQRYR